MVTVGKQSPWQLSFVYTSQVNLTVRTEPKLGKYLEPFKWVILNIYTYAIIYGMNQHSLALSSFDHCFLSAENTSAIVILQAIARVFYVITKWFTDSA